MSPYEVYKSLKSLRARLWGFIQNDQNAFRLLNGALAYNQQHTRPAIMNPTTRQAQVSDFQILSATPTRAHSAVTLNLTHGRSCSQAAVGEGAHIPAAVPIHVMDTSSEISKNCLS